LSPTCRGLPAMRLPPLGRRPAPPSHPAFRYRRPPALRRARLGLLVLVILIGLAAAYGGMWLLIMNNLRDGAQAWIADRHAEGFSIETAGSSTGGFPWVARLVLDTPSLAPPQRPVPWAWTGERLVIEVRPLKPFEAVLRAEGRQEVAVRDGDAVRVFGGEAATLQATLRRGDGWLPPATIVVRDLQLAEGDEHLTVARLDLTGAGDPGADDNEAALTYGVVLDADGVKLPERLATPLGRDVSSVRLVADLLGTLERRPWPRVLAVWRDRGGTVEVRDLAVRHGPLRLDAVGTLALDAAGQPVGAFTARLEGFAATVDALEDRGVMRRRDALAAKVLLGTLLRRPDDGGPPTLSVPLTLQDRKLFAGPVFVYQLPPIRW